MKRKRILAAAFALVLVFTLVAPAFAENVNVNNGTYKTFTVGYVSKPDVYSYWGAFMVTITSLSYTYNTFSYCYAQPVSNTGANLADMKKVPNNTTFTPYLNAYLYNSAGVRFTNADYKENGAVDNYLSVTGNCKISYS